MTEVINLGTIRFSPEDRKKICEWLGKVEATGFVGFVVKGIRPKPPKVNPTFETITLLDC